MSTHPADATRAPVPPRSASPARWIENSWCRRGWLARAMWPVSVLFGALMCLRRLAYRQGWLATKPSALPVVVIGNLSVGGTGKTPLCGFLVTHFQQRGWTPAIVSRGYGGIRHELPHLLSDADTAGSAGDEPLMLFAQTGVPVCVCVDRAAAVEHLAMHSAADIVFSDDGLQHLAMARVAELIVIDGTRGLGNRWLLPAGPLRESPQRLRDASVIALQVPFVPTSSDSSQACVSLHDSLLNGQTGQWLESVIDQQFVLVPEQAIAMTSGRQVALSDWRGRQVHAVAGIGNPQRFFDALRALGIEVQAHPMPDHHVFTVADLAFTDDAPILVTSKDAVKLRALRALPDAVHEVTVRVQPSASLAAAIDELERSLRSRLP